MRLHLTDIKPVNAGDSVPQGDVVAVVFGMRNRIIQNIAKLPLAARLIYISQHGTMSLVNLAA